jgi:hypothetical protein
MTQILNVTKTDEGKFEITDASGHLVDGPYETNAAAWAALDRLDSTSYDGAGKKRKPKRGEVNKPSKSKAKADRKMKREAGKAPGWIRSGAAAKFDPQANRQYRDYRLGTFGPASEVKRIDPDAYLAEKASFQDTKRR